MHKIYHYIPLIACALVSTAYSELLIVKKEGEIFVPLSQQDIVKDGDRLQEIMLKYQWPVVIASDLTDQEQKELLSAGVSYAEEKFIEKRVQEVSPDYGVVFIPTTLYELFCIDHYFFQPSEEKGKNLLKEAMNGFLIKAYELRKKTVSDENIVKPDDDQIEIELAPLLLEPKKNYQQTMKAIYDLYKKINKFFYRKDSNTYFYVNNVLVETLFDQYPELRSAQDSNSFSNVIKSKSSDFAGFLIDELSNRGNLELKIASKPKIIYEFSKSLKPNTTLINSFIALEYEARRLNKALLLRGASFGKKRIGFEQEEVLAGVTFDIDKPLQEMYGKKQIDPYSVSFGNSPFAGVFRDSYACAYNFLIGAVSVSSTYDPNAIAHGYALLTDKKDYFNTRVSRLFFIPPLSTLAGLLQEGEFFHPRTTLAVTTKISKAKFFEGLAERIADVMGIILITRDPLLQAEIFSRLLANPNNIRIIRKGEVLNYRVEGLSVVRKIIEAQNKAAEFYHHARVGFPLLQRKTWQKVVATEEEVLSKEAPEMVADFKKAWEGINNLGSQARQEALKLFKELVDNGYVFRTAKIAQRIGIRDQDAQIRISALYLLEALKKKKEITDSEFKEIVKELRLYDPDNKVKEMARSLR